jgi:hypothetical protein
VANADAVECRVIPRESGSLAVWKFQAGAIQFVGLTGKPAPLYRERGLTNDVPEQC